MIKKSLEQEKIFEEINNGTGNILINAKAGTGKCLGIDTLVVMSDGSRKFVQDVVVGDKLIGDNGTIRNVLSTTVGRGKLYKIKLSLTGESFICNGDHILTCKETSNNYLTKVVDISVENIINKYEEKKGRNQNSIARLLQFRYAFDIKTPINDIDYYNIGRNFLKNDYNYEDIIMIPLSCRYDIICGFVEKYCIPQKKTIRLNVAKPAQNKINKLNILLRSVGFEFDRLIYVIDGDFTKLKFRDKEFSQYIDYNVSKYIKPYMKTFSIEEYSKNGNYYGFTIDGNGRFLINDFIVTHNTTTIVNSLEGLDKDKSIMMLAFNKHIANELKTKVPNSDKIRVSTTHALGWGAIRRKYKDAEIDNDKSFKIIRRKITRWNTSEIDNIDQYILRIKKMVDLCRVTITTRREYVVRLGEKHGLNITDEDARRVLSVMEDMYNDVKTFDFVDMIYIPAIDKKIWLFPSDYVFVDECIAGDNQIIMRDNKLMRLDEIYNKYHKDGEEKYNQYRKNLPEVLSYNLETSKNEYKKITDISYKGKKLVNQLKISNTFLYPTDSHLLYTPEGWRETKDLNVNDVLISNERIFGYNYFYPNDEQVDFITSYVICYYNRTKRNKNSFRIYIKDNQKNKYNFINNITPLYVKSTKENIKTIEYNTGVYHINDDVFNKNYVINNLTDKQLAIIYILSYKYFSDVQKYGFYVSVNTFDEMVYAKELFEKRYGQIFDIKRYIKGNFLVPRDQDWYFEKIAMYIPNLFKRYVPEKFWGLMGQYKYNANTKQQFCGVINRINRDFKETDVYDITVQDNNNYFVASVYNNVFVKTAQKRGFVGYLTHNCQDYNRAQQFMLNKIIKKDTGRLIAVGDPHQCQPIGTKVLMSDNTEKNIENISVGDMVISYDYQETNNIIKDCIVSQVNKRKIQTKLISVSSNDKISKYTNNHRCFVKFKDNVKGLILCLKNEEYHITTFNNINEVKEIELNKLWILELNQCIGKLFEIQKYLEETYLSENNIIGLLDYLNKIYSYPLFNKDNINYNIKGIFEINACNIIPKHMEMVHYNNEIEYHDVDDVLYEEYENDVYSLKIEKYETYIADGIVTHNSIYGFNGSDTDSFNWFRDRENTKEFPLSTSFRCAKRIIELAQTLVPNIRYKHDAEDGEVFSGSVIELAQAGDYVLARKNKPLVVLLFDLVRLNKMATIRGNEIGIRISEMVRKYKSISELSDGLNQNLNEMRDNLINNFGVIDFRNDPRYVSLEDTVEIVRFLIGNSGSIQKIIEKISLIFTDTPKGIVLSTVHKSKGLEADTVFIIKPDEIRLKTPIPEAALQERNLEYIAYTRAKRRLIFDRDWTDERI